MPAPAARCVRVVSQPACVVLSRPANLRAADAIHEQGAEAPIPDRGLPAPAAGRLPILDEVGAVEHRAPAAGP